MTSGARTAARTGAMVALGLALAASGLAAQGPSAGAAGDTEQIVVMIRGTLDGEETIGAGILVGSANDRLYVVTANHVVRRGPAEATDVRVELRSLPGEPLRATLTTRFDARRDVAVLGIAGVRASGVDVARLPFDRLGAPGTLSRGSSVYVLGQPQGRPWGMNVAPSPIASVSDSVLVFETAQVVPGHSGGALLDQRREIVGLALNVQPPDATARNIEQVVAMVRDWGFPVALRKRFELADRELVSAGEGFTCALRDDGAPFCWGANDRGQIGTGSRAAVLPPSPVTTTAGFASVSAGSGFACGLTVEGSAYCWGNAAPNDLGPGPVPGEPIERRLPVRVSDALKFRSLSASHAHACGVTTDGEAYCWGANDHGELGDGSTTARDRPVRVATTERFRSVSAGLSHTCALTTDGRAICWGSRLPAGARAPVAEPRPTAVAGSLRFASVSAGLLYTCGVTGNGAAYCWGSNEWGNLGDGTRRDADAPRPVAGGHRFRSISAMRTSGRAFTCGLTVEGKALCWGWDAEALGQQVTADETRPGAVVGGLTFRAISVGFSHACGLTERGAVYCWGDGRYGQLGDGASAARVTPSPVAIPR